MLARVPGSMPERADISCCARSAPAPLFLARYWQLVQQHLVNCGWDYSRLNLGSIGGDQSGPEGQFLLAPPVHVHPSQYHPSSAGLKLRNNVTS